ncbi:glutamate--tRNA ligase [Actinoalloteichus spitiensis]|uniref:glutamate--tRNA ligase n=1 Tax=Actinoalloteichus spitiensis TaxID=252394 RepID=UPI000474BE67|nr:glutamate--tRNA ligase family protein [Actinoalloteichus spitiensis]
MLDRAEIDALFPVDLPEPAQWEERYPPRQVPENAHVTRFGPSPTGYVHIGNIYVSMINQSIAHRSEGAYLVRIEDTDQTRVVDGAVERLRRAFEFFGVRADEDDNNGVYGPYHQSQREAIYLSYARQLLREGKAYLCFATEEELTDIRKRQEAAKLPTGYYGRWAIWRDADPAAVQAKLHEGAPYVVRFRSPDMPKPRAEFIDAIRGPLSAEDNRNDAVILKSSANPLRLPTYHFAHVVDDHLMRVNLVIRGDEWISSVPLHMQLFDALGFTLPTYAHIAPLMKKIPGGKRKLSKRKDFEASVGFYIEAGYPVHAILYYLRGLANGRLAELPLEEALEAPIQLDQCGSAGPLVDLAKLEDISADYIGTLTSRQVFDAVRTWAAEHDPKLVVVLDAERDLALRALAIEREGVDNPRKDLRKWSDFRQTYGFFFPQLFTSLSGASDDRLTSLNVAPVVAATFIRDLADDYEHLTDPQEWFSQIRELAAKHGFASTAKEYKKNPDAYTGSIREASQLVRVALTGSTRSPDLHAIAQALGDKEVLRRLRALAAPDEN